MIAKVDKLGRVVIPKVYREEFDLRLDSEVNILPLPDGCGVAVMSLVPHCAACGTEESLEIVNGIALCSECLSKIRS